MLHFFKFPEADTDCVEYFAGGAQVTKNMQSRGKSCFAYDIKYDAVMQDMCSPIGFLLAMVLARRVKPKAGLIWLGTVCSSWVWIAKASTARTFAQPRGDDTLLSVREGNIQAARSALIMVWCYVRSIVYVLEQPHSSVLFNHPSMSWMANKANSLDKMFHIVSTYMGAFAADTPKQTILASNSSFTQNLVRVHPGRMSVASKTARVSSVRSDGRRMITGGGKILKDTQTYTAQFGDAVASSFVQHGYSGFFDELVDVETSLQTLTEYVSKNNAWDDAELEMVAAVLTDAATRDRLLQASLYMCGHTTTG